MFPMIQRTYLPTLGGIQYSGFDTSYKGDQRWLISLVWPNQDLPRINALTGWIFDSRDNFTADYFKNVSSLSTIENVSLSGVEFFQEVAKINTSWTKQQWVTGKSLIGEDGEEENSWVIFETQKMLSFLQYYLKNGKPLDELMKKAYVKTIEEWSTKDSSVNYNQWLSDAKTQKTSPSLIISPTTTWYGAFSLEPDDKIKKRIKDDPWIVYLGNLVKKVAPYALGASAIYLGIKAKNWYDEREDRALSSELRMRQLRKLRKEQGE